jgi:hypothetical protein
LRAVRERYAERKRKKKKKNKKKKPQGLNVYVNYVNRKCPRVDNKDAELIKGTTEFDVQQKKS